ncbi:MAG: 2-methylfumaryl-CoA isomerase, partial [Marinovum sp.]|nr:2-methylfumaryl-CoA isomerase [Marinovum sp.]
YDNLPAQKPPKLGQHTEEILADVMRLGSGEIGGLFDAGIIGSVTKNL